MGKWKAGDSLSWAEDRVERDPGFARTTTSGESERAAASATTNLRPILGGEIIGICVPSGIARNGETFGAKSCEKDAWWKNQTATFPPRLEIPQTPRGIPTFRTASAAAVCMTNTYRTKGDISIVLKQGTFLMHYDTYLAPD